MAKRKPARKFPKINLFDFLAHPHDTYMRTVLSVIEVALEWIEFALPPADFAELDLESLKLEKDTFSDKK